MIDEVLEEIDQCQWDGVHQQSRYEVQFIPHRNQWRALLAIISVVIIIHIRRRIGILFVVIVAHLMWMPQDHPESDRFHSRHDQHQQQGTLRRHTQRGEPGVRGCADDTRSPRTR